MIVLFSDLHLSDTPKRSTFNPTAFIDRLTSILNDAVRQGIKDIKLVLLGDIFEILKSKKWLENDVRPWQQITAKHVETVEEIVRGILDANRGFLQDFSRLAEDFRAQLEYIPGNHDGPINTAMGIKARELLQRSLAVPEQQGEEFQVIFVDPNHRLIARHGHEWDSSNRYGYQTVSFGDAIVIDLILRLPILSASRLGINEDDPLLDFLHEIDNVRPHTLRVISQWVYGGLGQIKEANPRAVRIIDGAFKDSVKELLALAKTVKFESFTTNRLRRRVAGKALIRAMSIFGSMNVARWIDIDEGESTFRKYALRDFQTLGKRYQYIVCGHTHKPELTPLEARNVQQARLYINTGTWRRVRSVSQRSDEKRAKRVAFSCWEEECIVSIFSDNEQESVGLPAYNFQRLTRGK